MSGSTASTSTTARNVAAGSNAGAGSTTHAPNSLPTKKTWS
ncbi:hypothetical protein [Saccharothrix stipae]